MNWPAGPFRRRPGGNAIKFLNIFAGICLATATPLIAHAAPRGAPGSLDRGAENGLVIVPFAPPLDRPLRYRVTREVTKDGRTASTGAVQDFVFSRRDEGYRLSVHGIDSGVTDGGRPAQEAYRSAMREFELPFVLLISEDGVIEGMENEEAFWSRVMELVRARMARTAQPGSDGAMAMEVATGMIRDTTSQGRLALITQHISPIFEYGGTAVTPGEEIADEVEGAGMMGLTFRNQVRIRPERVENNHLFISVLTTIPREELVRATEQFAARIPVTGRGTNNEADRARILAELRNSEMSRRLEASYEVDLETGLTLRHRSEDRSTVRTASESRTNVSIVTIERQE